MSQDTGGGLCTCHVLTCPICNPSNWTNPLSTPTQIPLAMPAYINIFHPSVPQGWECPRCTRIYGPVSLECFTCNQLVNLIGPKK